jgi:hypothetical protein
MERKHQIAPRKAEFMLGASVLVLPHLTLLSCGRSSSAQAGQVKPSEA